MDVKIYSRDLKEAIKEGKNSNIENFLGPGRSTNWEGTYDPKELKMGIEVEKEHTNNPKIAERIAKDHLAELPDYYTRLYRMEQEGKQAHEKS